MSPNSHAMTTPSLAINGHARAEAGPTDCPRPRAARTSLQAAQVLTGAGSMSTPRLTGSAVATAQCRPPAGMFAAQWELAKHDAEEAASPPRRQGRHTASALSCNPAESGVVTPISRCTAPPPPKAA
jgi:hypothetical protein